MFEAPSHYLTAAPIIVTSPTTRCGTTLVQRLLCASDNAFVYGEDIGLQIRTLTHWFVGLIQHLEQNGEAGDEDFRLALDGRLTDWRPGLSAPTKIVTAAWVNAFYQMPMALANYGSSIGRPVWGFKYPAYGWRTVEALLSLLPRAKVIYIFRNPIEALKSAKARKFVTNHDQVAEFSSTWAEDVVEMTRMSDNKSILLLKYESLIYDPLPEIRRIEAFCGVDNIRVSELDLKVNTFAGDPNFGLSADHYIKPAPLTDAERDLVLARAGPIFHTLYGGLAAH